MIATDRCLVRHGESDISAGSIQHEYPLSELGREQARLVGERWPEFFANPSPLLDYAHFGGESATAFYERVAASFVETIWEQHWRQRVTVVVVCHAETINAILHHLFRMPFEGWMMFSIDHTAVTMLDVRMDRPRVRYVNDSSHLGDLSRGHRGQVGGEAPRSRPR